MWLNVRLTVQPTRQNWRFDWTSNHRITHRYVHIHIFQLILQYYWSAADPTNYWTKPLESASVMGVAAGIFVAGGPNFRGPHRGPGAVGRASVGVWRQTTLKQNLNFREKFFFFFENEHSCNHASTHLPVFSANFSPDSRKSHGSPVARPRGPDHWIPRPATPVTRVHFYSGDGLAVAQTQYISGIKNHCMVSTQTDTRHKH